LSKISTFVKKSVLPILLAFALVGPVPSISSTANAAGSCPTAKCATLTVHYKRTSGSYSDWGLWLWAIKGSNLPASQVTPFFSNVLDSKGYGLIETQVPISDGVTQLGLIPRLKSGWTKDMDQDRIVDLDENNSAEIWIQQGDLYI
jgi:hypothetical protein